MKDLLNKVKGPASRRLFMKKGLAAAGTASVGAGLLANGLSVFGQESEDDGAEITKGDIAILRFLNCLRAGGGRSVAAILRTRRSPR